MIKIVKIDQTQNWDAEILKQHGIKRVFGVYAFDSILRVNCCEFTPSYECHWLEDQADFIDFDSMSEQEIEAADEMIREGGLWTESVQYFHCHSIDSFSRFKEGFFPAEGKSGVLTVRGFSQEAMKSFDEDGRRENLIEEVREYACSGCV